MTIFYILSIKLHKTNAFSLYNDYIYKFMGSKMLCCDFWVVQSNSEYDRIIFLARLELRELER